MVRCDSSDNVLICSYSSMGSDMDTFFVNELLRFISPRKPLRVLFFFVPGAARFFFSFKRKRNVGRNILPFTREDQTRFTMRINRELLEQIKAEAEKNKRSAATEIE